MKNTIFAKLFKNEEPEILREIAKLKKKETLLIIFIITITGLAFVIQLFAPVGLKISILVIAIWLVLLVVSLFIIPSLIVAIKAFSSSNVKKSVAFFIAIICVFYICVIYMVYNLIPFFSGGLKLLNEG